jgi:hypothetical protein
MIDVSNVFKPGVTHTLSATTTSGATRTSAFSDQVTVVMLTATDDCFIAFGGEPTATTSSVFITQDTPYLFGVSSESLCADITSASTSTVYITELSR